ncbi:MAG: trypsin-like peptidase domain-containing protein [Victivallaceae bacterium]|nr:trypsin-like peptidase domain-containing protein [Victivallaceae bacterium]
MNCKWLAAALCGIAVAGCGGSGGGAAPYPSDFQEVVRGANSRVFPAVVYIHAVAADTGNGTDNGNVIRGSGVIVSPDGEVLTNFHVADKTGKLRCQLNDDSVYDAELVGADKDVDLALLRLKRPAGAPPLPYAELDAAPVEAGDFVMAMGAPWGMNRSVSIGIISCASRYLPGSSEYTLWYQADASISPGNSGGPLVNTGGRVVGLNTMAAMAGGDIGFSLPAATIADVLPRLREYRSANWAWFGLDLQPLRDFDQNIFFDFDSGVIVSGTEPDSPARLAGLLPKDRIVAIDGVPVTVQTAEAMPDFRRRLGLRPFDVPVRFSVRRGSGQELEFEFSPVPKGKVEGGEKVLKRWGFTAKAINRFNNPELYHYRQNGVFVFGIDGMGNSAGANLRPDDIVLSVNNRTVETLDDIQAAYDAAISGADRRSKAVLTVLRNGSKRQLVIDFSSNTERE